MSRNKLSSEEITAELANLPGWFDSFAQALGWMVSAGVHADKMDHHPEWSNVYNSVTVSLVTHDLDNSISNLDVELANKMEQLANNSA